jgi:hypothetical protein
MKLVYQRQNLRVIEEFLQLSFAFQGCFKTLTRKTYKPGLIKDRALTVKWKKYQQPMVNAAGICNASIDLTEMITSSLMKIKPLGSEA